MRAIKYRELKQLAEQLGSAQAARHLEEAMNHKDAPLRSEDFSIRELGEVFLGKEVVNSFRHGGGGLLLEAESAVDSTAFSNITGVIIQKRVLEAYEMEAAIASTLISHETSNIKNEQIPGIDRTGDVTQVVHEGTEYPVYGFGERFQTMPQAVKRGHIVQVTKEAVFYDNTGQVLRMAAEVGKWMGIDKEKRIWDIIYGITNNYNTNNTAFDTYQAAAPWINVHGIRLIDWSSIDSANRLWDNMTDPATGEPVNIGGVTLIVQPAQHATALRILSATTVWHGPLDSGAFPSNTPVNTLGVNPILGQGFDLAPASRLGRARLAATSAGIPSEVLDQLWVMGDFKKAFVYIEHWPITVVQAPVNNEAEFKQDIVARFKVSEYAVAAVKDPRYSIISSGQCDHSSSGEVDCIPEEWPMDGTGPSDQCKQIENCD